MTRKVWRQNLNFKFSFWREGRRLVQATHKTFHFSKGCYICFRIMFTCLNILFTCLNVCVYVDELHALFKAPEHTLGTGEKSLEDVDERPVAPLLLPVLHLVLQVLEHDPDHLDDGNDEAAKGSGAQVEAKEAIEGAQDGAHSYAALVPETLICLSS